MKTTIHYCKYCGKPYSYQLSGNGCHNELNNELFCPECMEIMLKALKDARVIKHKYHPKYREMTKEEIEWAEPVIADLDNKYNNENENNVFPRAVRHLPISGYKKLQGYVHYGKEIIKCFNEDGSVEYLILCMYDSVTKTYGDIYKDYNLGDRCYRFDCFGQRTWKAEDVPVRKMDPPSGTLFFNDINSSFSPFSSDSSANLLKGIIKSHDFLKK